MTKANESISDEELTAYLDQEADAQLADRIDRALETDQELSRRLDSLMLPMDALREAFAIERLGPASLPVIERPTPGRTAMPLRLVASVVLAFGIGISGGYLLQPQATAPGWIDVVASYQSLYMTETVVQTTQDPEVAQGVLAQFQTRSGVELSAATSVEGLDFRRAQVLGFNNKPLMQMAYLGEDGTPFALCVIKTANADSAFSDRMAQGLAATSWVSDGVGYLVIGGADQARTRAFAEEMKTRLERS
ncbi:anti-sigma factor family protein [Tritonibacter horizontis]|uniref:Transmembrane transcriptional regulator (Anti-sigma factor) n=1 Tax=Tritonibacter horizontis TaxID=1768241 RepID=A0A132C3V4_9RHOB|nr:hypothetical protein [Tritonibacter horizontis]KUP94872.1 hypothetical protein TRIHO_02060 [Tritonibacter horizontis]